MDRGSPDDWRALMPLSISLPGGLERMNAKHQASVGGKSSLPGGLTITQLRPGQAAPGRRGAPRVLGCTENRVRYMYCSIIRFVTDTEQTFYRDASTCRIITKICFLILLTKLERKSGVVSHRF